MKIKEIEEDYKIKFGVNPDMKVSTYLRKKGLPSLAKAFDMLEESKTPKKRYIIRKIVEAANAEQALTKASKTKTYDIQVLAEEKVVAKDGIGFDASVVEEDD